MLFHIINFKTRPSFLIPDVQSNQIHLLVGEAGFRRAHNHIFIFKMQSTKSKLTIQHAHALVPHCQGEIYAKIGWLQKKQSVGDQSIPFSAFWLRSSVVSVLISLISDMWVRGGFFTVACCWNHHQCCTTP
ncbi:hypothetical protein AAZX31_08G171700 [Glycine max]